MTSKANHFRLNMGMTHLERWAANAGQVDKNAVYEALFAISDGSVFRTHKVLDDVHWVGGFFVLVRDRLVIKIRFRRFDAFDIVYIGSFDEVPDIASK